MACDCENNSCLEALDADCDGVLLKLASPVTGVLTMQYEFNERWYKEDIEVTEGINITVPAVFNEFYTHKIKFYNEAYELVNDTCYTLNTSNIASYAASGSGGGSGMSDKTFSMRFNMSGGETTIQNDIFITATIFDILHIDDMPQTWILNGITLDQNTGTFTFPNIFSNGQWVVIQGNKS